MNTAFIDPVEVAEKVLATPRGWSRTSVFEIKAMAAYVLYQEDREGDPEQPKPIFEVNGQHLIPMIPEDADTSGSVLGLVKDVLKAHRALENARFSPAEKGAERTMRGALEALAEHFGKEA